MNLEPIMKMSKDIKDASHILSAEEARFLVDAYYQMQDDRIRSDNRIRSMDKSGEPNLVLQWLSDQSTSLEKQVKTALERYANSSKVGRWLLSITGIGPVITAGLMAHIDIEKAETAGAIWRYAGLDPTQEWKKGEKRPWNASLKTLCWKAGESFVKVSGKDHAQYGKLYVEKKEYYQKKNEADEYKEEALKRSEKVGKSTEAYKHYKKGKLPPGHIHARAKRYAVKIFLSHLFDFWYKDHYDKEPPKPFAIAILGHAHEIKPQ